MVSIIIPTLDSRYQLVKLVDSIHAQNYPMEQVEIFIVYNFDKPILPMRNYANVRTLIAPAPGVNHARNTGLQAANGEIILFIDDDCLLRDKNYLQKIDDIHTLYPNLVAVGGPYVLSAKASFWDRAYQANMDLWLNEQKLGTQRGRGLLGGNASYKSFVFSEGFRFTPGIKYGGSETPMNFALFEKYGPHYFSQDLSLEHQSQMGFKKFAYKAFMQGKGFAWQTKLRPQQIQKPLSATNLTLALKAALFLYSFLFMVGFRTSILERRWPVRSFAEEVSVYLYKPFLKIWLAARESFLFAKADYEP